MIETSLVVGNNQMWSCSSTSVDSTRSLSTQHVDIVDVESTLFDVYIYLDVNVTVANIHTLIITSIVDKIDIPTS